MNGASAAAPRTLVVWIPDWPLLAAQLAGEVPEGLPAALLAKGRITACSAEARAAGVVRGLRLRDAQARCPGLAALPADPERDAREFEPVVAALEEAFPGVHVLRPGLVAVRARGAVRFYGSEPEAGGAALEAASRLGLEVRAGIADSVFAAEQAARTTTELAPVRIVASGTARAFLAPLPVAVLGDPQLASLLSRLGLGTLGAFAALPAPEVRSRFGAGGLEAHARARGEDPRTAAPRVPPVAHEQSAEFEPGLARVDQIAFAVRPTAEAFVEALRRDGLACTELRVQITDESGSRSERCWGHPHHFGAGEVVDRVRWQLQAGAPSAQQKEQARQDGRTRQDDQTPHDAQRPDDSQHPDDSQRTPWRPAGSQLEAPVVRVRLSPERTDRIGRRGQSLFGGMDERLDHGLRRLQTMLGHGSVVQPRPRGGRLLAERNLLVPWGEAVPEGTAARAGQPWPGSVPEPAPATVFTEPVPVRLLTAEGQELTADARGRLAGAPAWFCPTPAAARRSVLHWAGPWPLRERWWDAAKARRAERLQIVDSEGEAWLLLGESGSWRAEARYD
ncbi:DNA polymerase Y family protein [Sinomonas halotolerans]|uniref:DNA polymerase Y family protein n=1 Tax=Sinomonas halotolerans TaxID=1644133 RepID=A0ABU9WY59_9MICC